MSRLLSNPFSGTVSHRSTRRLSTSRHRTSECLKSRPAVEVLEDRYLLSGGIREFEIPTPSSQPRSITAGPDGNLWFTEALGQKIGRIRTDGTFLPEFSLALPPLSGPEDITAGSDGHLWLTAPGEFEAAYASIGRVTTAGQITFLQRDIRCQASDLTVGPDGNLWFTVPYCNRIGRLNPFDEPPTITEFTVPTPNSGPSFITAGPDGKLWFTERFANQVGRINTDGTFPNPAEFRLPTENSEPAEITTGPDGQLWFAECSGNKIGQIAPDVPHTIMEWPVPTTGSRPCFVVAGPDGYIWLAEFASNKIGRLNPYSPSRITEFPVPTDNSGPYRMTPGPDGNLWFVEYYGNKVAKLHVLTATGTTFTGAAGQEQHAVVANFHDDEPGMRYTHYRVDIDWGDGTSAGQAWTAGNGNWVATGSHTYAQPGEYWVAVTLTDTHAPTGMTTTTYSYVQVLPAGAPGGGGETGRPAADLVAALLHKEPERALLPGALTPAMPELVDALPQWSLPTTTANVLTPLRSTARPADDWLGQVLEDALTAALLAG